MLGEGLAHRGREVDPDAAGPRAGDDDLDDSSFDVAAQHNRRLEHGGLIPDPTSGDPPDPTWEIDLHPQCANPGDRLSNSPPHIGQPYGAQCDHSRLFLGVV
ncbi:hypothetical protein GCM10022255_073630 [Dactylosporangium darangshiense]|uniref:Uncharacterized protein n=1 Tax=Dactylosporangium darangshiense TaxID=579108 RepID=A0ABP8DJ49_9ACTN